VNAAKKEYLFPFVYASASSATEPKARGMRPLSKRCAAEFPTQARCQLPPLFGPSVPDRSDGPELDLNL